MVIAQVSIVPLGTKTSSVSRYVAEAISVLKEFNELKIEVTSMATNIEAQNLDILFTAIKKAHEKVFTMGVDRVITQIKIDDRKDKQLTIKSKLRSVNKYLNQGKKE